MSYKPQQNLFVVLVLTFFGKKLPVHLLCTIISSSPDDVILPKKLAYWQMISLNKSDHSWHPPSVNKVTHDINSNHIDVQYPKTDSFPPTSCKSTATLDLYQKLQY